MRQQFTEYGPIDSSPQTVWEATRDVLADQGYLFSVVNSDSLYLQTRWNSLGRDWSRENHRYRVTLELRETGGGATLMDLVVDHETCEGIKDVPPEDPDWVQGEADTDRQEEIVFRVKKLLVQR